ncbi:MAG: hypothetical protein ABWK01_06090 [Infirmifilum sp.]
MMRLKLLFAGREAEFLEEHVISGSLREVCEFTYTQGLLERLPAHIGSVS